MSQFANRLVLLLTQLAINALALVVVDALFAGVTLTGGETLVAAAVLLAVVNTYVRPALVISSLSAFLNWFLKPNSVRIHVHRQQS